MRAVTVRLSLLVRGEGGWHDEPDPVVFIHVRGNLGTHHMHALMHSGPGRRNILRAAYSSRRRRIKSCDTGRAASPWIIDPVGASVGSSHIEGGLNMGLVFKF
jgi:hypothetical protein